MIVINVDKAKTVAHELRRQARAEEFKPLDEAIAKQIPGQADGAEASRLVIRDKYAVIQTEIDSATDVVALKSIVEGL